MSLTRRHALGLAATAPALLLWSAPARAKEPEVFAPGGLAIHGIDPLAYATRAEPVPGTAAHAFEYKGATWRFATPEARAAFAADPDRHSPEFGGYCAFAASRGYLAPTIPEAWAIHEGRLYLNASLRALELWSQDIPGNIAKGRANWPGILG